MKYVIFMEPKEPYEESMKKTVEIEKKRIEKGDTFSAQGESIAQYRLLSEPKGFSIVETDDVSKVYKWAAAYGSVIKFKISPILTREEYEKATQ